MAINPALLAAVQKLQAGGYSNQDDNKEDFWRCETDSAGNGFAVIRFLPAKSDDQLPFTKIFDHGFQGPGGWFIEKCPTTIDKECPVCEANGPLWNSGLESDKGVVRKRKRRTSFISNIKVISDPKNPQNEGKIFKFKYGKKIFDMIATAMQPPLVELDAGEAVAIDPFSLTEGANFKLKIRRVEKYANFEKSSFDNVSTCDIDWKKLFDLSVYNDEKMFKSYEDLKKRFLKVTAGGTAKPTQMSTSTSDMTEEDDTPFDNAVKMNQPVTTASKPAVTSDDDDDDDDDMSFFRSLAADD